jgi:hypothetical protein
MFTNRVYPTTLLNVHPNQVVPVSVPSTASHFPDIASRALFVFPLAAVTGAGDTTPVF